MSQRHPCLAHSSLHPLFHWQTKKILSNMHDNENFLQKAFLACPQWAPPREYFHSFDSSTVTPSGRYGIALPCSLFTSHASKALQLFQGDVSVSNYSLLILTNMFSLRALTWFFLQSVHRAKTDCEILYLYWNHLKLSRQAKGKEIKYFSILFCPTLKSLLPSVKHHFLYQI